MLLIDTIADLSQVSKPSNDNLHKAIRSILNYRPPQDYVYPDDGFDRLALDRQLEYTEAAQGGAKNVR